MSASLTPVDRALLVAGAVVGLLGVGLSARAAHGDGGETLRTAAHFLLFHAPAILALSGLGAAGVLHRGAGRLAAVALVIGLALFSGDLALRALAGRPLLPMAAPAGGVMLMAGWLLAALGAFLPARR